MSLWAPPLEQPLVVTFVLEDGSPEIATGHHVMDRAGIFDPQRSGHSPIISHGARPKNRTSPREATSAGPACARWLRFPLIPGLRPRGSPGRCPGTPACSCRG